MGDKRHLDNGQAHFVARPLTLLLHSENVSQWAKKELEVLEQQLRRPQPNVGIDHLGDPGFELKGNADQLCLERHRAWVSLRAGESKRVGG